MKNVINLTITLLLFISTLSNSQTPGEENKQFEIGAQQDVETYADKGIVRRKTDNAIVQMININKKAQGKTPEEMAVNYIQSIWPDMNFTSSFDQNLNLQKAEKFNSGQVVRYRQYFKGIRVDRNEIVVKLNRNNLVRSVQNSTVPISESFDVRPVVSEETALNAINKHLNLTEKPSFENIELVIHTVDLRPILSWQINIVPKQQNADWECFVDAITGDIVAVRNIICTIDGTGNVFNPSPTYSAGVPYGTGNFIDNNDATNSDLEGQMINVTLQDIENVGGMFRLNGPYASVFPANSFDQATSNFNFTRDQDGFEATNCYYHLDKSMRYINEEMGVAVTPAEYSGGVRYDPIVLGLINAGFSPSSGQLTFGDGDDLNPNPPNLGNSVDAGEDALIILHELGHGIHHWLTGENHGNNEGLSEGLSDYWGASGTRNCGDANIYDEWQEEYHNVFHWGLMNVIDDLNLERTTNFTGDYCANIGNQPDVHASGQWISTALMKIYSDLGKFKTDQLVLETMPLLTASVNLQQAGAFLFQTAEDLNFSANDLCIIYGHLDAVLCISQPPASVPAPTGNLGNVYMKDTQCDNGDEVNPDNGPMWLSEDIWVRHDADGSLEHQNPEYKVNSPNHVYVRIRGIGCEELTGATLQLYFSKASTGLTWPTTWNNFFLLGPNGVVLAGDEITTTPITIPAIAPGEEWITSVEWWPPNPDDFFTETHHFCLLGRIISNNDPMFVAEGSNVSNNTKNNNNIAWKNISVFDIDPNNIIAGPISVFLGCEGSMQGGSLGIKSAQNSLGKDINELGRVYVELKEPLKSEWINNGRRGTAFTVMPDEKLMANNDNFKIEGINIRDCNQYVNVYFEPANTARFAAFDLVQLDPHNKLVGGERFEYRPAKKSNPRSNKQDVAVVQSDIIAFYPNPASGLATITVEKNNVLIHSFSIFDLQGKQVLVMLPDNGALAKTSTQVDVSNLHKGLYVLVARDNKGLVIDELKFVKE